MKKWTAVIGFAALCIAPNIGAQNLLSNPSLSGSATASITSVDYRYTKHTRGGSGRGGGYHTTTYYTWDPHTDELLSTTLAMVLNGSSGTAAAAGTFYAPAYSDSASAATSVSSTTTSAVFTTSYKASTALNTPQVDHQKVTAAANASSTFYFTLTSNADVTVSATGNANGTFALYGSLDEGVGVFLALYGPGTATSSASLGPGSYWITSGTSDSAVQDTQLGSLLNLGSTNANYSFRVTFKKNAGGD